MKYVTLLIATLLCAGTVYCADYELNTEGEYNAYSWDFPSNWTDRVTGERGLTYPSKPGDRAFVHDGDKVVDGDSRYDIYLNNRTDVFANVDMLVVNTTNQLLLGNVNDNRLYFSGGDDEISQLILTNLIYTNQFFLNDTQFSIYWDALLYASNDLDIIVSSAPYVADDGKTYTDSAGMILDVNSLLVGDGEVNIRGNGAFCFGQYYGTGPTPMVATTKPVTLHGMASMINDSAIFGTPIIYTSETDCKQDFYRSYVYILSSDNPTMAVVNVDLVLTNGYLNHWSNPWYTYKIEEGGTFNSGSLSILDWGLVSPDNDDVGGHIVLNCDVKGDGELWAGYSDSTSGTIDFRGSISPGYGDVDIARLIIVSLGGLVDMTFGEKGAPLDLNVDVDGMTAYYATDHDGITIQNAIGSVPLGDMNLNVNVMGHSNPYRSNMVLYSTDDALVGSFDEVNWAGGRTGEVVYTPGAVYLTGIPPLPNFFDVYDDSVILVQGETQQVLHARSPFAMTTDISADEPWITVQSTASLSNDIIVDVPVTVPVDQPVTNGYGLSQGTVTFAAAADSTVMREIDVYVLEPGYFELDQDVLYFVGGVGQTNSELVEVYSPLTVTVDVSTDDAWVDVDLTQVSVTNDDATVEVIVADGIPGATSAVQFENTADGVTHTAEVRVVSNGFFDVGQTTLEFVTGETQKYFTVSSPLSAVVDIEVPPSTPWVSTVKRVRLMDNGYNVPVQIPSDQLEGSTSTLTLRNACFPTITRTVTIEVVPEPGLLLIGIPALCAMIRRRVS